jgi:UDP-glucuronate 4-epimerase
LNAKLPFAEDDPIAATISPYATTKRAGELHVFNAHHLHDLPAICLRLFTAYGPRQRPEMAIARFIRGIEAGETIPFYGDGSSRRDYTYVDDVAAAIDAALAIPAGFEIVNVGGAHPVTLRDLVSEIERSTGRRAKLERLPEQAGDVPATYAATEKAERLLGFRARVGLSEGIARSVAWHRSAARGGRAA